MKRNRKTAWAWNLLLVLVCIALAVCFGGLLAWDAKAEAVRSEKLMQEAKKDKKQEVKQEVKKDKKKEEVKKEEKEPAKPILPQGISFWGDEFFTAENELQYSSRVKLEEKLKAEGYTLEYANKTLAGAGTLSVMKMAGVPQADLDKYIEAHKASAGSATPPVTETGIRDLTEEEMKRSDKDYIPIITMGYYGGWNKDPKELAEQQQKVLNTFGANKDKFIIVGVRPMDGSVNIPEYEKVMKETWGEHYISTIDICTVTTTTADGQTQVADALYEKLLELGYIAK
ncbi:hypothetical protein [Blautia hansenii]|jgi:hypothetical protein|uniref:hypothetical protein n=1 Tax=Blautia hansenii TaxID=1322 RepID=UPI0022DFE7EC|nr:hypothetical protein [Blautia hansenii]